MRPGQRGRQLTTDLDADSGARLLGSWPRAIAQRAGSTWPPTRITCSPAAIPIIRSSMRARVAGAVLCQRRTAAHRRPSASALATDERPASRAFNDESRLATRSHCRPVARRSAAPRVQMSEYLENAGPRSTRSRRFASPKLPPSGNWVSRTRPSDTSSRCGNCRTTIRGADAPRRNNGSRSPAICRRPKRSAIAVAIAERPHLDGQFDEPFWESAGRFVCAVTT